MPPEQPSRTEETPVVRVDGREVRIPGTHVTGVEILSSAGLDAGTLDLYAKGHRGMRIGPQDTVEIQPGSEFVTRPRR